MSIRIKITLLITAAGFLSSLAFSCIVLLEAMEQPFRIIDSELNAVCETTVQDITDGGRRKITAFSQAEKTRFRTDRPYWIRVLEPNGQRPVFQSELGNLINIVPPDPGKSETFRVVMPKDETAPQREWKKEVSFRVKTRTIQSGGNAYRVSAGRPVTKLEKEIWDMVIGIINGLIFSTLILVCISYYFAGLILKPIVVMNDLAKKISEKNLDLRLPVKNNKDEFTRFAETLNHVFNRLQHSFENQKQMIADASHELKTPLTMMRLSLENQLQLHHAPDDDSQAESLAATRMMEHVLRMDKLVKNLLDLSKLEAAETVSKENFDLSALLFTLIEEYHWMAEQEGIVIRTKIKDHLIVLGDQEKLVRAFSNLFDNAIKYNEKNGRILVTANQEKDCICIGVENSGKTIPADKIGHVFKQFFRVEKSRSLRYGGSGLGLAIVKRIIELHDGKVTVESLKNHRTRFTVILPAVE